jgi:hypothetical protein
MINKRAISLVQVARRFCTSAMAICFVLLTCLLFMLIRGFFAGDEISINTANSEYQILFAHGELFYLAVDGYPQAPQHHFEYVRGHPQAMWNVAAVWGPADYRMAWGGDDVDGAIVEFAKGKWKNAFTQDLLTPMRYTAVRIPQWPILVLLVVLSALFWGTRRLLDARAKKQSETQNFKKGKASLLGSSPNTSSTAGP